MLDYPWLEEKIIKTWLSLGVSWGMLQQRPVHLPASFSAEDISLIRLCLALQELSSFLVWRLGQEQERESRRCPLGHSVWDWEGVSSFCYSLPLKLLHLPGI